MSMRKDWNVFGLEVGVEGEEVVREQRFFVLEIVLEMVLELVLQTSLRLGRKVV